ncbi:MAG: phosphoribosylaminoimidazolesuccinocarboxamide synthase [Candidatus Alcyoniella australis]|nr:phosphoribosylaminoimidazolesuccinocarboxamide synthase [Candidatus Alcyoniella australis]
MAKSKLIYSGSVKDLYLVKPPTQSGPGVLRFAYTDDFSVFDYGKMPDAIPGKGAAMATLSGWLFEQVARPALWRKALKEGLLERVRDRALRERLARGAALKRLKRDGMNTHYRGMVDTDGRVVQTRELSRPSALMEVEAVNIVRPRSMDLGGGRIYNYNAIYEGLDNFLVPLEVVFRFGVPRGSSLLDRLADNPEYVADLGLKRVPLEGATLRRPLIELFSKLEPADRFLNSETALNFSGLSNVEFVELIDTALLLALLLTGLFSTAGFKLWDGKFEFIKSGALKLGDAITPDELRLTTRGVQISKEPLRQWYKRFDPQFLQAMSKAKTLSRKVDKSLAAICSDELGTVPQRLSQEALEAVAAMYLGVGEALCGPRLFEPRMPLKKVLSTFKRLKIA